MLIPHRYQLRQTDAAAVQVQPSAHTPDIKHFCPGFEFTDGAKIDFPQSGRPIQHSKGAFFKISAFQYGDLYDWIVETPHGFLIVKEEDFPDIYEVDDPQAPDPSEYDI